ncbi:MAG: hypothetical protein IJ721_06515 [Bacteroidales bacterium]|nr:hypothetical protein [Bacteroidales bacterium]
MVLKYGRALPPCLALLMLVLFVLFMTAAPSIMETILSVLLLLILVALLVSWAVLLANKQWKLFLSSFLQTVAIVFPLGLLLVFAAMFGPGYDNFGKHHAIPDGMEYGLPLEEKAPPLVPVDSLDTDAFLQIYEGSQGGIYRYDFYYGPLPAGEIFLRCYEATENLPLSKDRLPEHSSVAIGATTSFSQLVRKKVFTIYEGDWEDYYAARIEVWYRDAETKHERKLLEKVYRVEGWMR